MESSSQQAFLLDFHHIYWRNSTAMIDHNILLVEDDPLISKALALSLPFLGFNVTACETFRDGLQAAQQRCFDLLLLDVNLPDGDGFALCRTIRTRDTEIPILMLTAKTDEDSAVAGIECGADDYIRKPYGIHELSARMRRLLDKRQRPLNSFGSLRIDSAKHLAWAGEHELNLGKREFSILALLISRDGAVATRTAILETTDTNAEIYDRTIDSHLSHLRRKLKLAGAAEQIVPVYGVGYRLELP
ncbi:MAG TPA: response regulator transcription factor [Spongiibacteraceae bacterium]